MSVDGFYNLLASLGYNHPVHPILVHVTIGLVMGGVAFSLLARLERLGKYAVTARHCVTLAFVTAFPTILFGLLDWLHFYGGALTQIFLMKMILGGVLVLLLSVAASVPAWVGYRSLRALAANLAAFLTVVGLGYYGGELIHSSAEPPEEEGEEATSAEGSVSYAQVDRIMQDACVHCHNSSNKIQGLDLTSYEALMAGSKNGSVVEPGKPSESELVKRIDGTKEPQMPMGGQELSEREVERVIRWVEQGAPEPGE